MLSRLIYVSEPQLDLSQASTMKQLTVIMAASRRNNEQAGVTGALAYEEGWFFQVLEGDRRAIWRTFERISDDERHTACQLVEMTEIEARLFGTWWMGLAVRDEATAPAFAPFMKDGILRGDEMGARDILALMTTLARLGLRRDMRVAA